MKHAYVSNQALILLENKIDRLIHTTNQTTLLTQCGSRFDSVQVKNFITAQAVSPNLGSAYATTSKQIFEITVPIGYDSIHWLTNSEGAHTSTIPFPSLKRGYLRKAVRTLNSMDDEDAKSANQGLLDGYTFHTAKSYLRSYLTDYMQPQTVTEQTAIEKVREYVGEESTAAIKSFLEKYVIKTQYTIELNVMLQAREFFNKKPLDTVSSAEERRLLLIHIIDRFNVFFKNNIIDTIHQNVLSVH